MAEDKVQEQTKSVPESSPSTESLKEEVPLKDESSESTEAEKPLPITKQSENLKKSQSSSPKKVLRYEHFL